MDLSVHPHLGAAVNVWQWVLRKSIARIKAGKGTAHELIENND